MIDSARRKIEPLEPASPAPIGRLDAVPRVVTCPPRRIHQRFVGFQNLPEPRFRGPVARIDVRVKSARKSTIRPLDVGLRRAMRQAKDYVEIHTGTQLPTPNLQLPMNDIAWESGGWGVGCCLISFLPPPLRRR